MPSQVGATVLWVTTIRLATPQGRWLIAATALGSGIAFLDGTVVNAALPAIGQDFHASISGLQWVVTSYLLAVGSLLVLGGSLGDRLGRRRIFVIGVIGFSIASLGCGLAPTLTLLVAARLVQGVAAALLVPGSLALISATIDPQDRGAAIGRWTGATGVASAIGPFVGGWLIDAVSWRLVFLINVPLAAAAVAIAARFIPETRGAALDRRLDFGGAATLSVGLAGVVYALIEQPRRGWAPVVVVAAIVGVLALLLFAWIELRHPQPMVPLSVFRNRQFAGGNAVTFVVYAALGAVLFLLTLHLQQDLGYSALEAGASTLPITVMMLLLSSQSGALAQRFGPRLPMTIGPVVLALAFVLFRRVAPGVHYVRVILPAVVVMGLGLVITVSPLTTAVLSAITDSRAGVASAINNAVSRVAALLSIATLPALAGVAAGGELGPGFRNAMSICGVLCLVGGALAWVTIRRPDVSQMQLSEPLA
jgi:EmrB/QacA subfamily drug resistance transporter